MEQIRHNCWIIHHNITLKQDIRQWTLIVKIKIWERESNSISLITILISKLINKHLVTVAYKHRKLSRTKLLEWRSVKMKDKEIQKILLRSAILRLVCKAQKKILRKETTVQVPNMSGLNILINNHKHNYTITIRISKHRIIFRDSIIHRHKLKETKRRTDLEKLFLNLLV